MDTTKANPARAIRALAASALLVVVRGGFAGAETSADAREAGKYSTVDGQDAWTTFAAQVKKPAEFERVVFTRSRERGFVKSNNGSLTLNDCQFVRNNVSGKNVTGSGAYLGGNSSSTEVAIEGCKFDRNAITNFPIDVGQGFGLFLEGAKSARIVDCSFDENGYAHSRTNRTTSRSSPTAMTVKNATVAVTNCTFVGNSLFFGGASAVVWLSENCGGSTFDHCVFKGNRIVKNASDSYAESATSATGTFNVGMKEASQTVDITSCTFAYNISGTIYSSAGLNVIAGTANVRNSIFYGNLIPASGSGENDVMVVGGSGAANLSYTMIDHLPATATYENMVVGVPLFVTPLEDFVGLVYTNTTKEAKFDGPAEFPKVNVLPKDMRFRWDDGVFEAVLGLDVHSLSRAGYYKNDGQRYKGAKATSPAVDAGDPSADFRNEPTPNGRRLNLGFYGNTAEAAHSPGGFVLSIR